MRNADPPGCARTVFVVAVALLLVTAVFAPVTVAAATPPESEPNDTRETAQSISTGVEITGKTTAADDSDWFAFQADRGETINVTISAGSGGETYTELVGPNGFIASRRLTGETKSYGTTVRESGTYYFLVEPDFGAFGAEYNFTVETYRTDGFEPNEDRGNATPITLGEQVSGLQSAGDSDWFSFQADQGETINVTIAADAGGETYTELVGPNGFIASRRLTGETKSYGTTVRESGTYYFLVEPDFGAFGAEYNFTVETYRTDGFEPNEDRGNATPITLGEQVSGLQSAGDSDWFSFQADRGETINVTIAADTGGDTFTELVGPDGNSIASRRLTGETKSYGTTVRESGTYYLLVEPDFGAFGAEYNFTVETYRTDPFEPNENRTTAAPLFDNPFTPTEAQLSLGDADWFEYRVAAGETIRVDFGVSPNGSDHVATIYGLGVDDNVNDTAVGPGDARRVQWTAMATGDHAVALTRRFGGTGAYNATITVDGEPVGPPNDRFERPNPPIGNQDRANATEIGSGSYADLGMVDEDRDVFAVDLSAGERLVADASFNHSENDIGLALEDNGGATLRTENSSTDGELLAYTAPSNGTYVLTVSGEANASARYTLDLSVIRQVDVTIGSGSDTLAPGNTTTYPVNVTSVSAGLSTANLTLASTNTSVVEIRSVGAAVTGAVNATVAADNGSVTANVTGLDPAAGGVVTVATLTVAAVENGSATLTGSATISTGGEFEYPINSVQNTTVTVAPPGSLQHESGVSMRVFTAVAGSDGDLDRTDVIAMVNAYVRTQPVDGVTVTRADVLALVQYYVINA